MAWDPKELVAVSGGAGESARWGADPQGYLTAIVEVSQPNYVPSHVRVRTRLSATSFEGLMPVAKLESVRSDSRVAAVSDVRHQELGW